MAKLKIDVSADDFAEAYGGPCIVGPSKTLASPQAWLLYLPGEVPCICDSFEDAADAMREWLAPRVKRRAK